MQNLDSNTIYAIGLPIAFGLILLEAFFSAWKNKNFYNRGDSLGILGLFIGNTFMIVLTKGIIFSFYLFLFQYNLFNISDHLPNWAVWVSAFFIIDFTLLINKDLPSFKTLQACQINHSRSALGVRIS